MSARLLVTGFGPFPNQPANPSQKLVARLADHFASAARMHFLVLPTEYKSGLRNLRNAIAADEPDVVLCFGVAANRSHISLERIGRNFCSVRKPDAAGYVPAQSRLDPDGALEYETNLPVNRLRHDLKARGLPVKLSDDAGDYVCNSTLYHLMKHVREGDRCMAGGFIHIPDPAQGNTVSDQQLIEAGQVIFSRLRL